jgi:hypothetical protein
MKEPRKQLEDVFSMGGKAHPDARQICNRCPVVYDASSKGFWVRDVRNTWIPVSESAMRRHIATKLKISEFKRTAKYIQIIQEWLTVDLSLELSGHSSGVYDWSKVRNTRVLVIKSPLLITPKEGNWPVIEKLIQNMLDNQWEHFISWCKLTDAALRSGMLDKLQSLVLCGPPNAGKSRVQNWIVTPLCGNREVLCYKYIGKEFTAHLFNAEHHKIEDEVFSKDWYHQNTLRTYLKNCAANDTMDWHRKYGTPIALPIFRRLTLSCNDTEEDMRILPPLDETMMDKLSLYYCKAAPMPMKTNTLEERQLFERTIRSELPAFVHFLHSWEVPSDLIGGRDGLRCIHHSKVLQLSRMASPEFLFFEIAVLYFQEMKRFGSTESQWKGTATQLHKEIVETIPNSRDMLQKLCPHHTTFGGLLGKLYEKDLKKLAIKRALLDGYNTYKIDINAFISGNFLRL